MGGRRRLKAGAVRLLGHHDGVTGRAFRRAYDAFSLEFDISSPLLRLEASRAAVAWANLEIATRALELARRKRATGAGRRPGARDLERAARRQGLADASYAQAVERLRELAARRPALSLAERLSRERGA